MKRSFTFTLSRKISTAPYENADVFVAEGFEVEDANEVRERFFEIEKAAVVARVKRLVDGLIDQLRR